MIKLFAKLLLVQKDMKAITKSETNPFLKNKYFNINGLLGELKPVLNTHGVLVIQPLDVISGIMSIRTEVIDVESGETLTSVMTLPEVPDAQKLGAAISYYRRYALTSLFALEGEDEDGNKVPAPKKPDAYEAAKKALAEADSNNIFEVANKIRTSTILTQVQKDSLLKP